MTFLSALIKKGLKVNLEMAKEIVKARLTLAESKPVVALAYNQGVKSLTKEARDYLSSDEGSEGLLAGAVILDSPFSSFLGNFYLSVAKPKIPARSFTTTEAALKWLKQFRK
ncbi:MAG: hypothetical protein WDO16_15245 [Bacteroidota bacterium]